LKVNTSCPFCNQHWRVGVRSNIWPFGKSGCSNRQRPSYGGRGLAKSS